MDLATPALSILQGFSPNSTDSKEFKFQKELQKEIFKNQFPSIDLDKADINKFRRVVLIYLNPENQIIIRHYLIKKNSQTLTNCFQLTGMRTT